MEISAEKTYNVNGISVNIVIKGQRLQSACRDMLLKVGRSSSEPCAAFHFRQPLQPSAGVLVSAVSPSGGVTPSHSVKMKQQPLELEGKFEEGDEMTVTGKFLKTDEASFYVNLCNRANEAIFHFNPRLYKTWFWGTRLVMNTMKDGRWVEEENVTPFHMDLGKPFTLKIKFGDEGFEVDMSNGFRYRYIHRRKDAIHFARLYGDIDIQMFKHVKERKQVEVQTSNDV